MGYFHKIRDILIHGKKDKVTFYILNKSG